MEFKTNMATVQFCPNAAYETYMVENGFNVKIHKAVDYLANVQKATSVFDDNVNMDGSICKAISATKTCHSSAKLSRVVPSDTVLPVTHRSSEELKRIANMFCIGVIRNIRSVDIHTRLTESHVEDPEARSKTGMFRQIRAPRIHPSDQLPAGDEIRRSARDMKRIADMFTASSFADLSIGYIDIDAAAEMANVCTEEPITVKENGKDTKKTNTNKRNPVVAVLRKFMSSKSN